MHSLPEVATIIGSGTMGPGIAATLVRAGVRVRVYDTSPDALDRTRQSFAFASNVLEQLDAAKNDGGELQLTSNMAEALADTGFVIEAVPERLDLKKEVLDQVEPLIDDAVIIATNTSGIPISAMAEDLKVPSRLIGMHWSNPPHLIPMIEVIPGPATAGEVTDRLVAIVESFGFRPVLEKEIAGFVENRILYAILRECVSLLEKGIVSPEGLDTCVKWGIGYKLSVIGPTRLLDMAGLDIYAAVSGYLNKELDSSTETPSMITEMIAKGSLGFKTEGGMYEYQPGDVDSKRRDIVAGLVAARKTLSGIAPV